MTRVALASLVLALVGCRVAPTTKSDPLPLPQPDAIIEESEPNRPEESYGFGYVTPGRNKGGLAWIQVVISFDHLAPEVIQAMKEVGLGPEDEAGSGTDAIDPRILARAGYEPREPTIWLVDDEGACEARMVRPHVAIYFRFFPEIELSWLLTGCDPARAWAPIGLFTIKPPERMRWLESAVAFIDTVDPTSFSGRAAPWLRQTMGSFHSPPDEYWLRELTIGDLDIAQIQFAGLWRYQPVPGEGYTDCDEVTIKDQTGRWRDSGFERYELGDDEPWMNGVELAGAFVVDDEVRWLVFSHRTQTLIITPGEEPQSIMTGQYYDESVAFEPWTPATCAS